MASIHSPLWLFAYKIRDDFLSHHLNGTDAARLWKLIDGHVALETDQAIDFLIAQARALPRTARLTSCIGVNDLRHSTDVCGVRDTQNELLAGALMSIILSGKDVHRSMRHTVYQLMRDGYIGRRTAQINKVA